jgi:hypothetical protein
VSQAYQRFAQLNLIRMIEVQHTRRGPALWRDPIDCRAMQLEVIVPAIPPGME